MSPAFFHVSSGTGCAIATLRTLRAQRRHSFTSGHEVLRDLDHVYRIGSALPDAGPRSSTCEPCCEL